MDLLEVVLPVNLKVWGDEIRRRLMKRWGRVSKLALKKAWMLSLISTNNELNKGRALIEFRSVRETEFTLLLMGEFGQLLNPIWIILICSQIWVPECPSRVKSSAVLPKWTKTFPIISNRFRQRGKNKNARTLRRASSPTTKILHYKQIRAI